MNYRRKRGMGLAYDSEGMPIEDPANTTWGAVSGGTYPLNPNPSLTQWLNQNSTMVAVGAGLFVVAILFAKAGR